MKPLFHIVEGDLIGNIIYHNNAVSPTIVGGGDSPESLLACCVPLLYVKETLPCVRKLNSGYNLEFYGFAIQFNSPYFLYMLVSEIDVT